MRAAKRQLDACGHQPPTTRTTEPETGHFIRFAIEVRVPRLVKELIEGV
jgi:hypothetical protein